MPEKAQAAPEDKRTGSAVRDVHVTKEEEAEDRYCRDGEPSGMEAACCPSLSD